MVDTKGERFENSFDPSLDTGLGIGDVSKLCDEPAHTIRFWEKEFKEYFSPLRTVGKQRRYGEEHLEQLLRIKKLLREDKFSIRGAKRMLSGREIIPPALDGKNFGVCDTHDLALHLAKFISNYISATI
jgi:DNA-binding transcriptional MerR regulator